MIGVVARVIIAIIIVTLILVAHFSPAFLNKYIYASQNGFNHHVPLKKHGRENSKKNALYNDGHGCQPTPYLTTPPFMK